MAFNYFSRQLLDTDKIVLSDVFPDKQQVAKNKQRVTYGLEDIVLYIKDATEDFKFYDPKYAELDGGVKEVVNKYFISIGKDNPFEQFGPKLGLTPEYKEGIVPKEPFVVEQKEGEFQVIGKGITSPADNIVDASTEFAIQKVSAQNAATALMTKIDNFKKILDNRQMLLDDEQDATEREDMLKTNIKQLTGLKELIEDGLADEFDKKRYDLLNDFIQKNS